MVETWNVPHESSGVSTLTESGEATPESPRTAPGRIVLLGATGFTGRLVATELTGTGEAPTGGSVPLLTARDPGKLARLGADLGGGRGRFETRAVDVTRAADLGGAIGGGDVVINCAGPFTELGEPVVARCVAVGASYVDTTGEQPWMRVIRERYHDRAREARVAVVNGMAFEWALGDCGAALLAERLEGGLRTLDVVYAWGGAASSRGTRRTSLRIAARRAWELEDGRWRRRAVGASRRRVRLGSGRERWAVTFGAGEVVTVPRWSEADTVRGWLVMGRRNAAVVRALAPTLPVLGRVLRPLLEPLVAARRDPTEEERRSSRFTIRLEGESPGGRRAALEVRGTDPYGLTAAIAVAGARRALEPGRPSGVLAPSQLVPASTLLDALSGRGVALAPEP